MRILPLYLTAALLIAACSKPMEAAPAKSSVADGWTVTVYTNGTIYTGLADPKTVEAVVVDTDGVILMTAPPGSKDWSEDEVNLVDLKGAVMFPGFVDAHAHLSGIGFRELTLNLEGTASVADLVARVKTETAKSPGEGVLYGRGWIETGWPEARMPVAADLDAVTGPRPVILERSDGHALVANSAALAAAGITTATPDPSGGKIERDAKGKATGVLIDNAMTPVMKLIGAPTAEQLSEALETGARVYASRGWTGVHNMSVTGEEAPLMQALDTDSRLPLRLWNAYDADAFDIATGRQFETPTIRNRAIKLYMDGALGSRGAQLIKPYTDRPTSSGLSLTSDADLAAYFLRAHTGDVQLAIHAIGDLANRRVIEQFETTKYGAAKRWRIEHTQVLAPEDIVRMGKSGLIASMQPSHAIGDLKFAPARLGQARLKGAYAWKSLLAAGVVVAGGSDAPVEVGSPLIEFYAAVARKDLTGFTSEGWHPEEALSREEALALFTSAPAFAAFQDSELGTIEAGKRADFTVFDRDLMTIPEADILTAKTVMTVVDGEIVYRAAP